MAIGYSRIIAKYNNLYLESWLDFISKNFILSDSDGNITILNESGEEGKMDLLSLENLFVRSREIVIKFWNKNGRAIASTLDCRQGYFVFEYYSMDELLDENDYSSLYSSLFARFVGLSKQSMVGGFIFDREGYMDDYLRFE